MSCIVRVYAGRVFFSDEATALYLWAKEEPNRIKASKLMESARRLEYAWRKERNDRDYLKTDPLPDNMIARSEMMPPFPARSKPNPNNKPKLRLA